MQKAVSIVLLGLGASVWLFGSVPEIDPGSSASALTLLAVLLFRSKVRK